MLLVLLAHIPIPITTELKFSLWTRFQPILHIKEVLDCFRLDLLLLMLVLVVSLLVLLLYVCVCVYFNLLSDNESNTIRVIWYFVMLYNCLVSFQL